MHISQLFAQPRQPLVVSAGSDSRVAHLQEFLAASGEAINQLLLDHGALLFRGFALSSPADVSALLSSLRVMPAAYVGGNSPRTHVGHGMYTSTEFPASAEISLHHEMSYMPSWPRRLFFFSEQPAASGGQTSLASTRQVTAAIDPEVFASFRARGLAYVRTFHPRAPFGKTWQATYGTVDRDEVLDLLAAQGASGSWLPGDVLQVRSACAATAPDPAGGDALWFNQAEQWHPSALHADVRSMFARSYGAGRMPHDCCYGDGAPLDEAELAHVRAVLAKSKLLFDWQRGDLLMLDNVLMMHGREPFTGKRRTLAYLSSS